MDDADFEKTKHERKRNARFLESPFDANDYNRSLKPINKFVNLFSNENTNFKSVFQVSVNIPRGIFILVDNKVFTLWSYALILSAIWPFHFRFSLTLNTFITLGKWNSSTSSYADGNSKIDRWTFRSCILWPIWNRFSHTAFAPHFESWLSFLLFQVRFIAKCFYMKSVSKSSRDYGKWF